jgi:hypothetical protein
MKIKCISSIPVLSVALLLSFSNSTIAEPLTFSTLPTTLVSETTGPYSDSINYTPFSPNTLTSATLKIFLSDDVSSFFPGGVIDAPREIARLTSVTDGSSALSGLPADQEVDPQSFDPSIHGVDLSAIATAAGVENPSVLPSTAPYFNLDVTDLINDSNSGTLSFSLSAPDLFADILPETPSGLPNPVFQLIFAEALLFDPNFVAPPVFTVTEDFLFSRAELEVVIVPIPAAIWLFGSSIIGLLYVGRNKRA